MKVKHVAALIVAAGRGTRAGGETPKQWQTVAGKPVIDWTLAAFRAHPSIDTLAVVLHADDLDRTLTPTPDIVTQGGADRAASVVAGLTALHKRDITHVLIHDVARPCISTDAITAVIEALDDHDAAAPAVAVTDALWTGENGHVTGVETVDGTLVGIETEELAILRDIELIFKTGGKRSMDVLQLRLKDIGHGHHFDRTVIYR